MIESLIAVARVWLSVKAEDCPEDDIIEDPNLIKAARLRHEAQIQVDIHKSIDIRATVFIVAYVSLAGSIVGGLKDNKSLLPLWLMLSFAVVTALGMTFSGISLWASRRNLAKPRAPEQILEDAEEIVSPEVQAELAAKQLSACEHITPRKRTWANRSLVMLVIDTSIVAFGVCLNIQA